MASAEDEDEDDGESHAISFVEDNLKSRPPVPR